MKIILNSSQFVFTPTSNLVNFDNMFGAFKPERLLAIINTTTGKTLYSTAGTNSGLGGVFSNGIYTNSQLTYSSSNAGQSASDILEIFYEDETAAQTVAGNINSRVYDATGNAIGSVLDPLATDYKLKTASHTYAGDGTQILSSVDPISGSDGLNVHLNSTNFGGQIGSGIPIPNNNNALSVGFLNGSVLAAPKMDPVTNELIVQATFAAAATQNVNITEVAGAAISGPNVPIDISAQSGPNLETNINLGGVAPDSGAGATTAASLRVSSNVAFNGTAAQTGSGATNSGTQRVVLATDQTTIPINIDRYGSVATTLGQKNMGSSIPVVISSDQSSIATNGPDLYITGAANAAAGNNNLLAVAGVGELDVSGYKSASVQVITPAGASGTFVFQGSNSTTSSTFQNIPAFRIDSASPNASLGNITVTASSNFTYILPIRTRYIRLLNNGTVQPLTALTRLSQDPYISPIMQVINSTAANLNATASVTGTLTSVGTITTVTGVTTVSTVTQSNTALPVQVVDVATAAITSTATAGPFTPTNGVASSILLIVGTVSGTNPTMDVSVEMSDDGGTSWFKVYDFPRITASGTFRSSPIKLLGNRIRYVQTIGGTSPSFQRSFTRLQRSDTIFSRFVARDRTINPNTLNSTSTAFFCEGASAFNFYTRISAQTTPATVQIQFSDDSTNWYDDPGTTITTAVGIVQVKVDNDQWRFARAIVSAAGTGITLDEFVIKAIRE